MRSSTGWYPWSSRDRTYDAVVTSEQHYHIGFSRDDLPAGTRVALLSGDPGRSELVATTHLSQARELSRHRGLDSFVAELPTRRPVVCATSGMGAPSMSIVVNELVQVGITTIIRIGTCGSIQDGLAPGAVVVAAASLSNQGATGDIAPVGFPAAADPFLSVDLARAAEDLGIEHRVGVVASTDTFFEGQERSASSANPSLLRRIQGQTDEYRDLGVLAYEMEAGTLFTMGLVYGFRAGCVLGVVAQRTRAERPVLEAKAQAVDNALRVALAAAESYA